MVLSYFFKTHINRKRNLRELNYEICNMETRNDKRVR